MRIISRRARLVCAAVATLTSAVILAGTVVGLTTPDAAPVYSAQSSDVGHEAAAG
jgi:hypothetical protein